MLTPVKSLSPHGVNRVSSPFPIVANYYCKFVMKCYVLSLGERGIISVLRNKTEIKFFNVN